MTKKTLTLQQKRTLKEQRRIAKIEDEIQIQKNICDLYRLCDIEGDEDGTKKQAAINAAKTHIQVLEQRI